MHRERARRMMCLPAFAALDVCSAASARASRSRAADLASAKSPLKDTPCECHYVGTLIDGTEFDSSIKRGKPATFAPSQVVKGWTEAMQLMAEGDKWRLFLPSELAYGDRARGQHITPGAVLIFELEILKVNGDVAAGTAARASVQKPNLAPPPPPPHAAVGCRVKVDGLAAKPQYNGLLGTVISWDGDKGRAGVKMDNGEGGAGLMLKPANLQSSDAPPPAAPRSPFIVSALRFLHPRSRRIPPRGCCLSCALTCVSMHSSGSSSCTASETLAGDGRTCRRSCVCRRAYATPSRTRPCSPSRATAASA